MAFPLVPPNHQQPEVELLMDVPITTQEITSRLRAVPSRPSPTPSGGLPCGS
jgi:hypothetical protein